MNKETVKKPLMRKPIFWISTVVGVFVFLLVVGLLVEDEPEVYVPGSNLTSERQQNQPPVQQNQPNNQSNELPVQSNQQNNQANETPVQQNQSPEQNEIFGGNESTSSAVQTSGLLVVPFPPSDRAACHLCDGTKKSACVLCNGTGKVTGEIHDTSLYDSFGLGGLANTLNELDCLTCNGTGLMDCMFGHCDGTMPNPAYREYGLVLKALADETGMRIFELESNQVSPYIALDFCTLCEGLGWFPHLKTHDTDLPLCHKCLAEGMRFHFIDSFTQAELTRSYDDYLSRPNVEIFTLPPREAVQALPGMRNNSPYYGGQDRSDICILYPDCRSSTHPGSKFCRSHRP